MIISESNQAEVLGVDPSTTINMEIDDSNKSLLMMILSQGLYSDGIGSLIRELTTNALDSQREAGNTNPIKVSLVKENGQFVFSVQDEGVGLSPDRVENVFAKYLSSTKRGSNEQLGGFGLGSKAPLSYTDSFTIISRYEGTEYQYMMFKGEEGTQLSLLDMEETDEHNGVIIKVVLKEDEDYEIFLDKMKRQLAYFEGVFFITEYDDIDNSFKIIKTDTYKYSELNEDKHLHLALDSVYYPLDFEKLGIESIAIPIAINLSLTEGIMPTPNREQLQYTPNTKKLILKKLSTVADILISKWNTVAPEAADLFSAEKMYNSHGIISLYEDEQGNNKIEIKLDKKLEKYGTIKMVHVAMPLYPNLPIKRIIETKSALLYDYSIVGEITPWKYTTKYNNWDTNPSIDSVRHYLFLDEGEALTPLIIGYIKWSKMHYFLVRKTKTRKLGKKDAYNTSTNNYYGLLQLRNKPRSIWRTMIDEYCNMLHTYTDKWGKLSNLQPTEEYLQWRKENRDTGFRRNNLKDEVTVNVGRQKETYDYLDRPTYDKKVYKLGDLSKIKHDDSGLYIYTIEGRESELVSLFRIGKKMTANYKIKKQNRHRNRIHVAYLSPRNYKKINSLDIPNWIKLDDVFVKKNKVLSQFLTKGILGEVLEEQGANVAMNGKYILPMINKSMYSLAHKISSYGSIDLSIFNKEFIERALKVYRNNKWFDYNIWSDIEEFYKNCNNFSFMESINYKTFTNYYGWNQNDGTRKMLIPVEGIEKSTEIEISKLLYNKFWRRNLVANKSKALSSFVDSIITKLAPLVHDEFDDKRDDDDDSDTQVDAIVVDSTHVI